MPTAIKFENISKQYRLGLVSTQTLSHDLNRWFQTTIRGKEDPYLLIGEVNDRATKGQSDYVWALKDIDFEVQQGDVLGIIGRNGAGKSTLLKILSKVTAPSTGKIRAAGRIASLLEVGTGFHPEMTGRENVYMNGAIMGMTKNEISRKLDEIVDFAGVERYIDTPTKRYSSGMTVRLGFAIAAHLEPEILVVDEVLAVGDAIFQKKAIDKMQSISKGEGRTILFVSHNMVSIRSLCTNGIVLSNGSTIYSGSVQDAIEFYIGDSYKENPSIFYEDLSTAPGNQNIRIKSFKLTPTIGKEINVESGLNFILQFYNYISESSLGITFELFTIENVVVFHTGKAFTPNRDSKKGIYEVSFQLPPNYLNAGKYKVGIVFGNTGFTLWNNENLLNFEIENTLTGQGGYTGVYPGILKPIFNFNLNFLDKL